MKNKLDRLFKGKLERHEAAPTPQAWGQVKGQIEEERKLKIWLSIAASIVLLAVSTFLIMRPSESIEVRSGTVVTPDYPMPLAEFEWNLPAFEEAVEVKEEHKTTRVRSKFVTTETVAKVETPEEAIENTNTLEVIPEMPIIESEVQEAIAAVDLGTHEDTNPMEASPHFQVQITYQASEVPAEVVDEKTRVGKLFAKARQIKPGEMLASLRETKNDFFSGSKKLN